MLSIRQLISAGFLFCFFAGVAQFPARCDASQAAADAEHVYSVAEGATAPRLLDRVEPEYTAEARQRKITGTVVMMVVIAPDGKAHDIRIHQGLGFGLDEKAIECVNQWTFAPGEKDGRPVAVKAMIEMNFRLP